MPPRSNKAIFAIYAAVLGGFIYVLWTIAARGGIGNPAASASVATKVNDAIVLRRNDLIQQAAFRAQAAAKSQSAAAASQTIPAPTTPVYTLPVQTYTPPAVKPRTTIS